MSSKINLQTCEYARKSSIFQDNQLILIEKMNLLGKVDAWDNLIRIKSESIVQELMGMILKEFCDNDVTSSPVTL